MVNRGYIFLKGDFLYFANDGLAFDKSGVIAVSRPNLSAKSVKNEDKPRDLFPKLNGKNWIKRLHNHSIENYCKDENLLISDRRAEQGATKDYQGRWLFEILQNIDDAIGPSDFKKYIGTKGLGFLSVLEIGHSPEFFSGNFNFKFSKKLTSQVLLKEKKFKDKSLAANPPEFQVIHFSNEDNEVNWFKKKSFTTVIKLSIYKDKKEQIIEDLESLDKNFLLFSRNLTKLTIKIDQQYEYEVSKEIKNLSVKNGSFKDQISINLKDIINKKTYVEKWILWGREWQSNNENSKFSSCMMALPFNGKKCNLTKTKTNFYNFFPTNDDTNTSALFHITFQLSQDRKTLQMWGEQYKWEDENCDEDNLTLLSELKKMVSSDVMCDPFVEPKLVLEIFQDLNDDDDINIPAASFTGNVKAKIKDDLIRLINSISFVPTFGNGFSEPSKINLWKYELIDSFNPNKKIQSFNLPLKNINFEYDLLKKYNASNVDFNTLSEISSHIHPKNNSRDEREKSIKLFVNYIKNDAMYNDTIFDLNLFENEKYETVNLNSGPFFKSNLRDIPKLLEIKKLSKQSEKLFNKYFRDIGNKFEEDLNTKFIENHDHFLAILPDLVSNNFVWKEDGYILLHYLISAYSNDTKKELSEELLEAIYLPTNKQNLWVHAKKIFLSKEWGASDGFVSWCEKLSQNKLFRIKSRKLLLGEINKRQNKKNKNKNKIKFKDIKAFFILCGARDYPNISEANFDELKDTVTFQKYREHPNSTWYNFVYAEYYYQHIDKFFDGLKFSDACKMASNMIEEALNFKSKWNNRRGYNYHTRNSAYVNFGLFQLANLRWIKHKPSIIRMDGYFSPLEIVISSKLSFQIFPQISKKDLISKNDIRKQDLDYIIEELNIRNNSFTKNDLLNFFSEDNCIQENYQKLIEKEQKSLADTQIREIYNYLSSFFPNNQEEFDTRMEFKLRQITFPCFNIDSPNNDFDFFGKRSILFNNTNLNLTDLKKLKFLNGFGIYFTNKNNFNFQLLTDKIEVKIQHKAIENEKLEVLINFIKDKWSLINFIQNYDNNTTKVTFEEFKAKTILCSQIEVYISSLEDENQEKLLVNAWKNENKFYIKINMNEEYETYMNVIYSHICENLFKKGSTFSLIRDLLNCNSEQELRETFNLNAIDPLMFSDYKHLHYQNDILIRNIDFKNEQIKIEKNKEQINNNSNDKVELIQSKEKTTKVNQQKKSSKAEIGIQQNKKEKKKSSPNKSFGKRLSGHFRPVNPRGIKVRDYFDDETGQNKEIGLEGEQYVVNILKNEGFEGVNLLGGNNKGYDIEYLDDNQTHFIEVKSLKGFWEDSDVLLSKAQFEKAQMEKDKYTICIVENISSKSDVKVYKINNPSEYFTKLQIDHGWKDFAAQIDKTPEVGNFIEIDGVILKILEIRTWGNKYQLELDNKTKIFYNPDLMILKDKKDID